ncbi:rho family-interacting cell polarization regulator 1 isoform X2 [Cololabis saira]|nr:rho family-interacting cell polarization regulator 1 isoform X2 [Cololabis saira]XP_061577577.1 rho family-interacting cell polarization regulator 1 isoform X2 [Cololabis saira]
MSLSVRPVRRIPSRSITRSQSFTGVNIQDKPYRNFSVFSTPGLSRRSSRASRMFTMPTKSNSPPKVPQPERLDQVYEALKKGLESHLQVHQMDLDSFSRQIKDSKRNSRLGFLYDLDKQVKVIERYIRRLEFHLSKIEELYEAYCLQRRLRDGASKMVKAYTSSSGSKEARESLAEANKGYKEYTENMCTLEGELENQLGEFHIKMKGLAGFARLCAGDQYEVFMKYGRQRWKLRGRMELNAKQVWDSEEMVFVPLVSDFLSVKVTELKSLANHVVIGNVSCETKDLFAALPQTVAVDINDLGTIKLSLEVTWNPFDKDDLSSLASTVNKAPSVSKRFSTILNQSPPDTPSLREQAFYSLPRNLTRRQHWPMLTIFRGTLSHSCPCSDISPGPPSANMILRRQELENGTAWSNSSESSDDSSSPQLSAQGMRSSPVQKAVLVTPETEEATGSPSPQSDGHSSTPNGGQSVCTATEPTNVIRRTQNSREEEEVEAVKIKPSSDGEVAIGGSGVFSRSLSHISESSADGVVLTDRSESGEAVSSPSEVSINDIVMEMPIKSPEPPSRVVAEEVLLSTTATNQTPPEFPEATPSPTVCPSKAKAQEPLVQTNLDLPLVQSKDETYVARRVAVEEELPAMGGAVEDSGVEDALGGLLSSMDDYRGQFPELQLLEQELRLLQVTLKGGGRSPSPSVVSLTVETALGSFDFLDTSDWEEDDEERSGRRSRNSRLHQDQTGPGLSSPPSPLTTGCPALDCSLVVHLRNCSTQLLRLGMFGPLRCGEMYALDRLLREAGVLQIIRRLDNPQRPRHPEEVIPPLGQCAGAALLWQQCVGQGSIYYVSADSFLLALSEVYCNLLQDHASSVFLCLTERVLDQRLPRRDSGRDGVTVTLFQLWSYLESHSISDVETHLTQLAEEVWLVQRLESCDQEVIVNALRRPAECSLRREGLHAVARLLKDPRGKVSASASSVLRGLAAQPQQREQALVTCLELLEDDSVDTRVCGCKALACLKAKESIDQLVYLCRTDKEEVRDAAKQALLVLGEEGKMAHRHVEISQDSLPRLFAPGSMASTAF